MASRVRVQGDLFHGVVPEGAVYIGRAAPGLPASPYRNPFKPGRTPGCNNAVDAVAMYDRWIATGNTPPVSERERQRLAALRTIALAGVAAGELTGRNVACWCKETDPCHGDPLMHLVAMTAGYSVTTCTPKPSLEKGNH